MPSVVLADVEPLPKPFGNHLPEEYHDRIAAIDHHAANPTVPIGKDDSENVEVQKFGDPVVPEYEIP